MIWTFLAAATNDDKVIRSLQERQYDTIYSYRILTIYRAAMMHLQDKALLCYHSNALIDDAGIGMRKLVSLYA